MATAEDWRTWQESIRNVSADRPAALQALYDAARRDGRRALPAGWHISDEHLRDLVHDVLALHWAAILEAAKPRAFFKVVLRNKAIDRFRRVDKRERSLDALEEQGEQHTGGDDPEATTRLEEVRRFLVRDLSPRDLRIFQEKAVLGHSSKEVAENQGVSAANVDQVVSRARRRLKEQFGADPE